MLVYVIISVGWLVSQVSVCGKNFNLAIFSGTVNMINVHFCMIVLAVLI